MTQPRSYFSITGDDRIHFLQGILTQDVAKLGEQKIQFAALLSPQGKLLHDLFLIDAGDHIIIDTATAHAETLKKRLTMYKLRARVTISDAAAPGPLPDPRHPQLDGTEATRIALAIPEFGIDIQPDTITAMDAGYDLLNAISFTKGCYVGQEVTARMHYKNIARKGFFIVTAETSLTPGDAVVRDGKTIATITSAHGKKGLAFLKFADLAGSAIVNNFPVILAAPAWMQPKLALFEESARNQ